MRALLILALLVASNVAAGGIFTEPAPLPEPGTLTLLAAGVLAAFKLRK